MIYIQQSRFLQCEHLSRIDKKVLDIELINFTKKAKIKPFFTIKQKMFKGINYWQRRFDTFSTHKRDAPNHIRNKT